tara:strand:+ start:297900 stop:298274 length:375 start_codon:yes stop_codon:yes gene_type:complete
MANVINGTDYLAVATNYANARSRVVSAVSYLFEAVYQIVLLQEIIPEVDLLSEFYNSYLINNDTLKSPVNFLPSVKALNNHVLSRSTATTLDAYLDDEGITVPQQWATLSASAGFSISSGNIDS